MVDLVILVWMCRFLSSNAEPSLSRQAPRSSRPPRL